MGAFLLSLLFVLASPAINSEIPASFVSDNTIVSPQNDWQYLGEVTGYQEYLGNWSNQKFRLYVRVIGGVLFYRAELPHALGTFLTVVKNPDYQNTKSKYSKYNYYVDWSGGRWYCNLQ